MTHADEGGVTDIVVSALAILSVVIMWTASIYIYVYRDWSPFKVKQVPVLLVSSVSGGIFIIADLLSGSHFNHFMPQTCSLWRYWLQLLLGFVPWISCLIIRSFRLYKVLILRKRENPHMFWAYLGILEIPWLILCIVGQSISNMVYDRSKDICVEASTNWIIVTFFLLGIYIVLFLLLAFLCRKIRDEYNEYKIVRIGVPLCLVPVAGNVIFYVLKLFFDFSVAFKIFGRALLTISIMISVLYFFWSSLAVPLYYHIRVDQRKYYEETFLQVVKNSSDKYVKEGVEKARKDRERESSMNPVEKKATSQEALSLTRENYKEEKHQAVELVVDKEPSSEEDSSDESSKESSAKENSSKGNSSKEGSSKEKEKVEHSMDVSPKEDSNEEDSTNDSSESESSSSEEEHI